MSPTINFVTDSELQARRAEVLRRIDLTEDALREGARLYTLSSDESEAWEELQRIDYLLGE